MNPDSLPSEMVLVPREPTPEMVEAFRRAYKEGSIWTERLRAALDAMLAAAPGAHPSAAPQGAQPVQAGLKVWYGSMPESNGRTNWTAIFYRGDLSGGFTIARSEYPQRVRYEADRVRFLIGELADEPFILDYDSNELTPCHLCGGTGERNGQPCWGLNFDGPVHKNAASPADAAPVPQATRDVLAERKRQVEREGWTPAHDDQHNNDELAEAAACYAHPSPRYATMQCPVDWPWDVPDWKPKDRRSNLVRAGALILAEIERLDRAAMNAGLTIPAKEQTNG